MIAADYVVVGAGLTGATIARLLADRGRDVVVVERRPHVAGNVYDYRHASGARVHEHGPHYFRCGSARIWRFVNRFAAFYDWSAVVASAVDGSFQSWPIPQALVDRFAATGWQPFADAPRNFEEACLARMPVQLYERLIKGYTEKQWGVRCVELDPDLAARISIQAPHRVTLTPDRRWNALPIDGYTSLVQRMLADLPVIANCDYIANRDQIRARTLLIFTGPIDELFGYVHGRLRYRAQTRTVDYLPNVDEYQPYVQVNYPHLDDARIRTIEWKHLLPKADRARVKGTVLTHEVPFTPDTPDAYEYPFPDAANKALAARYRADATRQPGLLVCGRLGEYRYYDMDQAIGRAMSHATAILSGAACVA